MIKMRAHFRLSRPYLNKDTMHFERKVLGIGKQVFTTYDGNTAILKGDYFNDTYYYPFVFSPNKNTWFGKVYTAGEESSTQTKYALRDYRFGRWYRDNEKQIIKPLFEERYPFYKSEMDRWEKVTEKQTEALKQIKHGSAFNIDTRILNELISLGFINKSGFLIPRYNITNKGAVFLKWLTLFPCV